MHRGQDLLRRIMGMQAAATIVFLFLGGSVVLRGAEGSDSWQKTERYAELGMEVLLPCNLKLPQCEGLHSIKWYRGSTRIFIFSMDAGIIRSNSGIAARADIEYSTNSSKTYLKIPEVQLEDGGLYRCEATYLAVKRECNNVQLIFLNVTMQPAFVRVIDENSKNTLSTGATLGPINEGSTIALYCESGKGKPIPTVEWFKGDQPLEATSLSTITDTGIGAGSSLLKMQITREELDATFTCKVNSIALVEPLSVNIKLDVHVRPLEMDLSGVVDHVVQGTKILLQCKVLAARPAANVTWQNGTQFVNESNERYDLLETKIHENEDSTSDTISYLAFTASVYDNGRTFKCYAENSVTNTEDLKPMMKSTTIEVLYPPIINMKPHNITVNESNDFLIFCDYEANPASLNKVTWLRDDEELVLNDEHYDGGITEQTALTVKNATPNDMGFYKCILQNNAGISISEQTVEVSVFYKPVVEVVMDPETPVNEADRVNVSLTCEVDAGNPAALSAVRWYLDGDLLKELPDCPRNSTAMTASTEESSTFCDIDPSKLLLESVGRSFHGNYSCEGRNEAGWGPISPSTPVIVYYKPGPASIFYEPRHVVKKQSLSITCFILDPGRPKVSSFKWLRGGHRLAGENNATVVIESVNLETEANFTCMAHNEAGDGEPASTFIDVSAAPTFIKKMHSYRGFVYNSPNVSIMCWVECAPICNISWLKDDIAIDFSKTNRYYVSNVYHPPNLRTNDFESVQSTLVWNLTAWPNGQLDRADDSVKFTCKSSSNGIGPGVESSTHFHVEFPPEDIALSKKIVNVTVDTIPETVECSAKARPKASFRWFREGSIDTIMEGHVLDFKIPLPRRSNGTYYCEASNYHGFLNISMVINVQFKPECHIKKERFEGQDYVVCSAIANPEKTDFTWSLKNDNDTLEQGAKTRNGKSYMLIDTSVTNLRTYVCVANNTIGYSIPCERDIPANHGRKSHIPWWHQLEGNLLLIIIIVTVIIILVLILICVAIYIVCRRKSSEMKYPNQANNNHVNSVSEALPDSGTKTFYENLPFHGIQAPPNKLVSPKFARISALHGTLHHSVTASPCSSRPPSRAVSLCDGSSGYESIMSHLGPHYNMPRSNSPVLKYNTLKPRGRKQKHSEHCRRHENIRRKYELYAIPIYKTCPHKSDSTTTIATIVRSMEDAPSLILDQTSASMSLLTRSAPSTPILPSPTMPPIPAPRTSRKTDPSKHTYQNVPPPVFPPKNASLPKLKTDSLYNYKEHYQQQPWQEMQQHNYPLPSNSSNQLTLPLTRNLYQSSIASPLQTSFVHTNNSRPSTLMHHESATTGNHLPAMHQDEEQQQQQQSPPNYGNHDARQLSSRRHTTNRQNERNRKHRKPSDRSKSKQSRQRGNPSPRRNNGSLVEPPACETSFQAPDLSNISEGMYKIPYPHCYEDNVAEYSADYDGPNSTVTHQQQQQQQQQQQSWEHQSNHCAGNNTSQLITNASDAKARSKTFKTRLPTSLSDFRKPSTPVIMQYELHFRDVGQEIDV
ncbi:hemicentin-2 isoform X5 [Linepithema humile]|uniref:hemicentin-2 isoform X5 n=1 Tax=Linepithema humile TaxID=83485 RepID=UPI00351E2A9A